MRKYGTCIIYYSLLPGRPAYYRYSLGSRPSPYVRVLIARGWANRSSGPGGRPAWDDSSRESRTVPRARPVVQAWHVIFLISGFFDSLFLADGGGEEQDDWLLG